MNACGAIGHSGPPVWPPDGTTEHCPAGRRGGRSARAASDEDDPGIEADRAFAPDEQRVDLDLGDLRVRRRRTATAPRRLSPRRRGRAAARLARQGATARERERAHSCSAVASSTGASATAVSRSTSAWRPPAATSDDGSEARVATGADQQLEPGRDVLRRLDGERSGASRAARSSSAAASSCSSCEVPRTTPPASDLCRSAERLEDDGVAELPGGGKRLVSAPRRPGGAEGRSQRPRAPRAQRSSLVPSSGSAGGGSAGSGAGPRRIVRDEAGERVHGRLDHAVDRHPAARSACGRGRVPSTSCARGAAARSRAAASASSAAAVELAVAQLARLLAVAAEVRGEEDGVRPRAPRAARASSGRS